MKSDRSHVVLWAKELPSAIVFLRPLGLRLKEGSNQSANQLSFKEVGIPDLYEISTLVFFSGSFLTNMKVGDWWSHRKARLILAYLENVIIVHEAWITQVGS